MASAGAARSSASVFAPTLRMNSRPSASAFTSGAGARLGEANIAPLSPITRANSPLASGEAMSALAASEPADSPAIVTLSGSPPKAAMLRFTHLERSDEIEHAVIAGGAMFQFGGEFRMGEKTQRIEAMVERNDEDAARGKMRAIIARLGAGADDKPAAVNPDHRRQPRAIVRGGRRPDVEIKAILGDSGGVRVDVVEDHALQRIWPEGADRAHAGPRRNRLRRPPAQAPQRRSGIRDALIGAHAFCVRLGDCERAAFDREKFRDHSGPPVVISGEWRDRRRAGVSSSPAKRALEPSASSMRNASFHFAMRSDRAKEPTFSCPAPQPIAR